MKKFLQIKYSTKILAIIGSLILGLGCVGDSTLESNSSAAADAIAAVIVELTNSTTGELTTFQWTNSSNNTATTVDTLKFLSGVTYNGEMVVLDTTGTALNDHIMQNPEIYQFFYGFTADVDSATFTVIDRESHYPGGNQSGADLEVGIKFRTTLYTSTSGNGELNVILTRFNQRVKTGLIAGDEIFLEVEFPVIATNN